ncbi:MAG: TetR/AcrR family transcriptional regulator [Caldilineaceae bacterium]
MTATTTEPSGANPSDTNPSDARQRVLDVAEELFMAHGYTAVTLRDIADALGIRQASLYYHFPEGKEQLFAAVAIRTFMRHRTGMEAACATTTGLRAQLRAVAAWFAAQPPLNLLGMLHADMPALNAEQRTQLGRIAYDAMFTPLRQIFHAAYQQGEIRYAHPDLLAGCFLTLMDGLNHAEHQAGAPPRVVMAEEVIAIMLDGLRPRSASDQ